MLSNLIDFFHKIVKSQFLLFGDQPTSKLETSGSTLFPAILEVQDRQPALDHGGGDRRAVRGGGLEAPLSVGREHGTTRLRGIHTATLRQSSGMPGFLSRLIFESRKSSSCKTTRTLI